MNQHNPLDFISVLVFVAATVFSPQVAAVLGPYVAIILASICGASFSLGRREKTSRRSGALYLLRVTTLAVLVTVLAAEVVLFYVPSWERRWLLVPIALTIGWAGDDAPGIAVWLWQHRMGWLDLLIKLRGDGEKGNK